MIDSPFLITTNSGALTPYELITGQHLVLCFCGVVRYKPVGWFHLQWIMADTLGPSCFLAAGRAEKCLVPPGVSHDNV